MKKYFVFASISVIALIFANCSSSKKVAKVVPKLNYETNMQAVVVANCSPCHIPAKGGNKRPYDNFANVKADIDEIIRRIELEPTARGFMPFKKNAKLSDSTIAVFKQWKADGLLEK
jgi:mono/diheme cytochrome c family protein